MTKDIIQVRKKSGKQGKKKWMKTINTDELNNQLEKTRNDQLKSTFKKPIIIEEFPKKSAPLDPNRFKRKQIDPKLISKTEVKLMQKRNLEDVKSYQKQKQEELQMEEEVHDVWGDEIVPPKRKNEPKKRVQQQDIMQTPAVMKPMGGQSYNPSNEQFEKLVDKIIETEGEKEKRIIVPKIKKIKKAMIRTRNKTVRQQQLDALQRKRQRLRQHYQNFPTLVQKQVDRQIKKGNETRLMNLQKQKQEIEQRKSGWMKKGPALLKSRKYQYQADIQPKLQVTQLSKMPFRESIIKDRIDSVYRRSLIEPKAYSANPKLKRSIRVRPPVADSRPYW